jgi:23S rRNA (pseudouridine1915-N3)-methyltransferase
MRLSFYLLGKVKEPFLKEAYQEYLKRLSKYGQVSLNFLEEAPLGENPSEESIKQGLDEEALRALNKVRKDDCLVLLDLRGKELTSEEFAAFLKDREIKGTSSFVFLVGSSYGLSDLLRKRADLCLSFGKLTTTHPLALLLALEQVYRAEKINSGETYHK